MMNLLEKITLYDILGYALPGYVLLYVLEYLDILEHSVQLSAESNSSLHSSFFIILGFLVGIILSELSELITGIYTSHSGTKKYIEKKLKIKPSKIKKALNNSGVLPKSDSIADNELIQQYFTNMFSDIQVDKEYSRIHNYTSAELLYKNMALVCVICAAAFWHRQHYMDMRLSIAASIIFSNRWRRFYERKIIYTIHWYVHKYTKK